MPKNLKTRAIRRLGLTLAFLMAILFLPAGSFRFWEAWLFWGLMAASWTYFFIVLLINDPALLERRLQSKESEPQQKLLLRVFSTLLYLGFILAGLDFRFGWSSSKLGSMPLVLVLAGQAGAVVGYWFVFWVMKTNSFAGSTIHIEAEQVVIEAGPYAWVRHPMYSGMIVTAVCAPFALGSYVAVPAFAMIVPVLILRLVHEEKTLYRELAGYSAYSERTRFRLLPWVW